MNQFIVLIKITFLFSKVFIIDEVLVQGKDAQQQDNGNIKGDVVLFHKQDKDDENDEGVQQKPRGIGVRRRGKVDGKINQTKDDDPLDKCVLLYGTLYVTVHGIPYKIT
jgi:hypothetical protein